MSSRMYRRRVMIVVAVICLALGAIGYGLASAMLRADEEAARAEQATVAAEALCEQVERAGGLCVVDPADLPAEPGPAGPQGEPGRGVDWIACTGGTWTVRYSDGTVDYDAGPCTGPPGEDGEDGADGEDGEDSTVPGPTGPRGPAGAPGDDGRSVVDTQCNPESGQWEVTYSDETVDSQAGPCTEPGPL